MPLSTQKISLSFVSPSYTLVVYPFVLSQTVLSQGTCPAFVRNNARTAYPLSPNRGQTLSKQRYIISASSISSFYYRREPPVIASGEAAKRKPSRYAPFALPLYYFFIPSY
jgi:hypothetical protein